MAAPFTALFASSLRRVRTCMLPLLLAAAIVSGANALPALFAAEGEESTTDAWAVMQAVLSGDEERLEALGTAMETETPEGEASVPTGEEVALAGGLGVLSVLVSMFMGFYILIVVVEGYTDPMAGFRRVPGLVLPIVGTSLWMFILSYVWVPVVPAIGLLLWDSIQYGQPTPTALGVSLLLIFLGVIIGLMRMPRLFFAPIILVRERTGIRESVRLSEQRTKGYWLKIVLNNLGFGIIAFILMLVLMSATAVLSLALVFMGSGGAAAAAFAMMFVQMLVNAWNQAFHTELALTIFDNPQA